MRVRIIATGKIEDLDDSYASRMIEQAKAVPAPPEKKARKKAQASSSDASRHLPPEGEG